jgi:single-strand DNA-binding protein
MINKVTLVGYVGRDPETKQLPSGSSVTNLSVATTRKWKNKEQQQQEETEWHRCSAFGKMADIMAKYLRKGSQVYIEGRLQTRKFQRDGQDHYATEVVVEEMKMLGVKGKDTAQTPAPAARRPEPAPEVFDDDIPF